MTEHNGNDRGQGPRRGGERSSSDGSRGGREFSGKAPRQGGGRPAKTGRDQPGRGPWKPRTGDAPGFRKTEQDRRGRPEGGNASGRPSRDGERFGKRPDREFPARSEGRRPERRTDERPERAGGWKPRSSDGPRGGGSERRSFTRDSNGYGRPGSARDQAGSGRRSQAADVPRREGFKRDTPDRENRNRDGQSRDGQRSAPWTSRSGGPSAAPGRERPFKRDANGYRRPDGDEPRASEARAERAPRDDRRTDDRRTDDRRTDPPARVHNPRDLRSANRPDRERSPEIDEGVTGAELDRVTRAQLRTLESKNGEWVAKHLVMAGRLIDDDPELSFQHALAASRRGGRLAAVREAVGLTAYAAGHYAEALREFRTYRRISGSNVHLPLMADSERGLGRPDRALDVARSEEANQLDSAGQVELAIVVSGARADLGQKDAALAALEISQLDKNRAFSYSPRLFRAYADALAAVGRDSEAASWRSQAALADQALGADLEPEIIDLDEAADDDLDAGSDADPVATER